MRNGFPLRTRLVIAATVFVLTLAAILLVYLPTKLDDIAMHGARERANVVVDLISGAVTPGLVFEDTDAIYSALEALGNTPDTEYAVVYRGDDTFVTRYPEGVGFPPLPTERGDGVLVSWVKDTTLHVLARVGESPPGHGYVQLGFSLEWLEAERQANRRTAWMFIGVLGGAVYAGMLLFGLLLTRPILALSKVSKQVSEGKLERIELEKERVLVESGDELEQLTHNFYVMLSKMQRALEFREEFLAKMSHELRTPLNAVLGITETFQEGVYGELTEKQMEMLATVEKSGEHLLSLINDILDLSKIEAGQETLRAEACELDQICYSTAHLLRQQVEAKGLTLDVVYRADTRVVWLDARRIRQVLLNLLGNAMKFTEEGGISLTVDDVPGEKMVCIAVKDSGVGIAEAHQARLFQPFFQVDDGLARRYDGTGLGLAISLRSVQLHGGRIELESRPGEGSCFRVYVPIETSPSEVPSSLARLSH